MKLPSVRAILANAASQGWEIHQIDVKNMYLNAELNEDVYMRPPPGYLQCIIDDDEVILALPFKIV
jgi:hypothetical protein